MKVLFLPHNFPGPFRGTASRLATLDDAKILFVSGRSRNDVRIPGVGRILVNQPPVPPIKDRAELEAVRGIRRATHMAHVLTRLKGTGFTPDIVIGNAGYGYSLYVKDIFPTSFLVAYAEGFQESGSNFTLFSRGKDHPTLDFSPERVRNFFQWNALHDCHMAYTSTQWQKSLYPANLAKNIQVFHEGVDTEFFKPQDGVKFVVEDCDLSHVEELITFSGRSLESNQVCPAFLHAFPHILEQRPKAHILIMSASSAKNNPQTEKWRTMLRETYDLDERRIHFINFRPHKDYRMLLQASHVHIFLSAPLALSSGIFEAMSCQCLVIAADSGPISEVISHGNNGFLYAGNDSASLAEMTVSLLERKDMMEPIRKAARNTITQNFNVIKQTQKTVSTILKKHKSWKQEQS